MFTNCLILVIAAIVCSSHATPINHSRTRRADEPRFAIGLGTLSPSYSQKLDNGGRLDFNHEKNGFSYSLSDVDHLTNLQSGESQNKVSTLFFLII
jgi:hypothetical protein